MDLTTVAAVSAAVLGLVNFAVTTFLAGRRERLKWAREALAEAFYEFIDASYRVRGAAGKYQRLVFHGSASNEELAALMIVVDEQMDKLRDAQTKVRLLAPTKTLDKAQAVRLALRDLCSSLGPELDENQYEEHKNRIATLRQDLIASAKRTMALRR